MDRISCPLCRNEAGPYLTDRLRSFVHCPRCDLVSADPGSHLDPVEEKREYDRHENDPSDPGYRRFLGRLAGPLLDRLTPGMRGLDFGCGPGPTLSVMLEEAGMIVELYDPVYRADPSPLSSRFEFVTCTEVVEHFKDPGKDWELLTSLLLPGGWLGVMTKLVISRERFASWHYKSDPTHVSFYSMATFEWIGRRFGLSVERADRDVFLLRREGLRPPREGRTPFEAANRGGPGLSR